MTDHNTIIGQVGSTLLKPEGIRRKGRSRIWLDDQGWWVNVVEFQPFKDRRGTTLNQAAMWLWKQQRFISFDEPLSQSARKAEFIVYEDESSFKDAVKQLVTGVVLPEIQRFREAFGTVESALDIVRSRVNSRLGENPCWPEFNLAHLYGLNGDLESAFNLFEELERAGRTHRVGWIQKRSALCRDRISQLSEGKHSFLSAIETDIRTSRETLKLPRVSDPLYRNPRVNSKE